MLSDYQFLSNGVWQITQGGQRWGWTEASPDLVSYGKTWNQSSHWQDIYGNATVLSVGVALEFWAVNDSNGLDQPLYADEVVINGVTYNITTSDQTTSESTVDEWSMYRHDLQRTGSSTSTASSGNLLWRFNTGDKIRSSPAIANGVVYQGTNDGYIYALNSSTGSVIWQYAASSGGVESSPAVVSGVVYVGCLWDGYNGYVIALNATTGTLIWRFATNSGIESSPAVFNGVVYIGSFYGYIYALNATNGILIWSYLTGGSTYSSPAIVDSVLYQGARDGNVYALNADNGSLIWAHQTGSQVYASPVVVNNVVYTNSDNGTVYALNATDGSEIWHTNIGVGDHVDASPAVSGGIVYVVARTGLYAFNATTGLQDWFFTSPYSPSQSTGYVYSCPAVANNIVFYGSCDGYVFALNANNASIVWSYRTGLFVFASPAIVNGIVYVGSYDGYLYALGGSPAPTPEQTPTPVTQSTATPTLTPSSSPTATSNTSPILQSTENLISTVTPTPTQTPVPPQVEITQPTIRPITAKFNEDETVNWILLAFTGIAVVALVSLFAVYKVGNEDSQLNRRRL